MIDRDAQILECCTLARGRLLAGIEPHGGRVDEDLAASGVRSSALTERDHAELGRQRGRPGGGPIPDRDLGAGLTQRPDRRPRGSTRPEHQGSLTGGINGEGCDQPRGVGVIGVDAVRQEAERVGGADLAGGVGGLVCDRQGGAFVRNRHVGADEALRRHRRYPRAELLNADLDRLVMPLPLQAERRKRRVLHRRRARVGDRLPEHRKSLHR